MPRLFHPGSGAKSTRVSSRLAASRAKPTPRIPRKRPAWEAVEPMWIMERNGTVYEEFDPTATPADRSLARKIRNAFGPRYSVEGSIQNTGVADDESIDESSSSADDAESIDESSSSADDIFFDDPVPAGKCTVVDDDAPIEYESDGLDDSDEYSERDSDDEESSGDELTLADVIPARGSACIEENMETLLVWCVEALRGSATPMPLWLRRFAAEPMTKAENTTTGTWVGADFYNALINNPHLEKVSGIEIKDDMRCALCHHRMLPSDDQGEFVRLCGGGGGGGKTNGYHRDSFFSADRVRPAYNRINCAVPTAPLPLHAFCSQRAEWFHAGTHWFTWLLELVNAELKGRTPADDFFKVSRDKHTPAYVKLTAALPKLSGATDTTPAAIRRSILGEEPAAYVHVSPAFRSTTCL